MLNAHDFGITGDGITNNTLALQHALNIAGEKRTFLMLPAGIYRTGMLRIPSYAGLTGEPLWSYRKPGGTILRLVDSDAPCLLNLQNTQGITLEGLSLEGDNLGKGIHGLFLHNDQQGWPRETENTLRLERSRIHGFSGNGVHLDKAWCFSIRHCMISHNLGHGIRLAGCDGFFLDNWLSGNHGCGFITESWNGANTFTANRIEWNHQAGMHIRGGHSYQINGNCFDRSGGPALILEAWLPHRPYCDHFSVIGNTFKRSGKYAGHDDPKAWNCQVYLDAVRGLSFTANTIMVGQDDKNSGTFTPQYGLVVRNLDQSVITANNLYCGAMSQLIFDLGGHGNDLIVRDNPGSLPVRE